MTIAEATHAGESAEVRVKRPVLLHEHHDVLDLIQRPSSRPSLGQRVDQPRDAERAHAGTGAAGQRLAACESVCHLVSPD